MQLCLMIEGQEGVTWPQWVALAQACERHGVPWLFRSDHYMNLDLQHPEWGSLDAWATLTALAAVTSTVGLGTLVSPVTFRHPSELARVVVTADHVSGGRVAVGIGAGWHEREHEAQGFPFPDTRTRIDVLEEQLKILHGSWGDERFTFEGRHYSLKDLDAQPKPVQRPRPPLIMGGDAGPRSVSMAARYADEYNTTMVTVDQVVVRRERVERACEQAGREPIPFSLMTGFLVGSDERELAERVAKVGAKIGGDPRQLASDEAWIIGTVDQATEQLLALRNAGVTRVMCQYLAHEDLETVALLGEQLAPRVA
jgi:F420-dependent oxidoreductase-like protein